MLLAGMPLKVKIIGIAVLAILTLSLVGTSLATLDQVAQEQVASPPAAQQQLVNRIDNDGNPNDNAVVSTFKFVCPFH